VSDAPTTPHRRDTAVQIPGGPRLRPSIDVYTARRAAATITRVMRTVQTVRHGMAEDMPDKRRLYDAISSFRGDSLASTRIVRDAP
jgi:hypothetical protein